MLDNMGSLTKSLTVLLGLSAFGLTGYMLYALLKKDDDDELADNYVRRSNYKTVAIKVPKDTVRVLIGRNGANIKRIQEISNTRIYFKDDDSGAEKICVIRGSSDTCNIAYHLINDFINDQPVIVTEDIWVPVASVRRIIGRGGEKIAEIQGRSGAKVTIVQTKVTLKGTQEQINVARSLIEEVVEQCQTNQQLLDESLAKREPRVPSKSPDVIRRVESPKSERISPTLEQQNNQFEVYVSSMFSPSRFWLQIVGPKATELDCLVEQMTEYYNVPENRSNHELEDVNEGDLVAAVFQYDKKWYRAEVLETIDKGDQKIAKLFYLDYGDTDLLPCKDLYELRTDLLRLHFQAIECFLARIEPAGGVWSEEAKDYFEELVHCAKWLKLSAKIHGYTVKEKTRAKREDSPVPGVDLYDVSNSDRDVNVAEEMVKNGFAVYKKGSDLKSSSRNTSVSNISVASSTKSS